MPLQMDALEVVFQDIKNPGGAGGAVLMDLHETLEAADPAVASASCKFPNFFAIESLPRSIEPDNHEINHNQHS